MKRGVTAAGTQRWLCHRCGHTYIWKNSANAIFRQRIWFERWLVEGYAVRQLAKQSGHRPWKIQQIIHHWLDRPPAAPMRFARTRRLIIDGTFIEGRRDALLAVMDADRGEMTFGGYGIRERPHDLRRVFLALKDQGMAPESATIDGNPHVVRSLLLVWPRLKIQRCLVHVQRQGLMWCRAKPKRTDAKKLRKIFLAITSLRSFEDKVRFLETFEEWEKRNGRAIEERGESGWVASDLRRARSMLLQARPYLFTFLDDPAVPKTTNALEGYFGRLKGHYRHHRGLSRKRRSSYFLWYFHLCKR